MGGKSIFRVLPLYPDFPPVARVARKFDIRESPDYPFAARNDVGFDFVISEICMVREATKFLTQTLILRTYSFGRGMQHLDNGTLGQFPDFSGFVYGPFFDVTYCYIKGWVKGCFVYLENGLHPPSARYVALVSTHSRKRHAISRRFFICIRPLRVPY